MTDSEIEEVEITLLLEAVFRRYGYDFRCYARASVGRRVRGLLPSCGCASVADLIPKVLHDQDVFARLAQVLSITVTEMFRDPFVYRALRDQVLPVLRTWPRIKVWHAGCATGEEVYSLAILLTEEGLYDRATIYATDFNDDAIARAREGIYDLDRMREFTKAYQEAGGRRSFADYYHARYASAVVAAGLKAHITFANHNLAVDRVFGEMHLVICRNVLIYFNRELQDRVLSLFSESLVNGGFLCLGTKEDLRFSPAAREFEEVDRKARVYKRVMSA
jgi:chemotaxis protein methyltransferase CheR